MVSVIPKIKIVWTIIDIKNDLLKVKKLYEDEINFIDLKELPSKIGEIDILINATSVGSQNNLNEKLIRREYLHRLKNSSLVYDIIYDPPETMLLRDSKEIGLDGYKRSWNAQNSYSY